MSIRLGVDVGGTNTDCVLVDDDRRVRASAKRSTTPDIVSGVVAAVRAVLADEDASRVSAAMLGTTQCTNAILERRRLRRVGVLRIGAPAGDAIPPLLTWPEDLRAACLADWRAVSGGRHVDGRILTEFDEGAVRDTALSWAGRVEAVAIVSVFAPIDDTDERRAAQVVQSVLDVPISLSSDLGTLGYLERENAAAINASLTGVADVAMSGFQAAISQCGITAPAYFTQNDGTLLSLADARRQPVRTIGSGPTNSLRGAGNLAGLTDAVVIDVGGTTSDIGLLHDGFPRASSAGMRIGGVATNFRAPDVVSTALGGGTVVHGHAGQFRIGPESVGHEIASRALCFGGDSLTLTDIAVALGHELGDSARVRRDVSVEFAREVMAEVRHRLADGVDRVRPSRGTTTVVAVGGGGFLVPDALPGSPVVCRPAGGAVANAVGAAIAEVGGDDDRIWDLTRVTRAHAISSAEARARQRAVDAGADPATVRTVDLEQIQIAYLPGTTVRIVARAVGALTRTAAAAGLGGPQ